MHSNEDNAFEFRLILLLLLVLLVLGEKCVLTSFSIPSGHQVESIHTSTLGPVVIDELDCR